MSDARVGVALLGFGFAGETFHAPLIEAEPRLTLRVVASSRPEHVHARLPDSCVIADPLAAIADPDVGLVVVATPNDTHVPLARAALEAGKAVVVDKPFTLTLGEAEELAAFADARGLMLSVFHNRRWDSDFLTVRKAIDDGLVGDVVAIESRFDRWRPEVRDRWREGTAPGAGILYDLGPHLIDQMLCLFGPPDRVSAWTARQRVGAVADDAFEIVLRWGERVARLSAGMLVGGGTPRWLVHGTRGTLRKAGLDIQEDQLKAGMVPGTAGWGEDPNRPELLAGFQRRALPAAAGDQRRFYASVAACLLDGGPNPVTPAEACRVMAVLDAARASAAAAGLVPEPVAIA